MQPGTRPARAQKLRQVDEDLAQRSSHLVWRGSAADRFGGPVGSTHQSFGAGAARLAQVRHLLAAANGVSQATRAQHRAEMLANYRSGHHIGNHRPTPGQVTASTVVG